MGVIKNLYYIGAIQTLVNKKETTVLNRDTQIFHLVEPDNNWGINHSDGLVEGYGDCISLYLILLFKGQPVKKMAFAKEGNLKEIVGRKSIREKYEYICSKEKSSPCIFLKETKFPIIIAQDWPISNQTRKEIEVCRYDLVDECYAKMGTRHLHK
ncbi:MAG TPA: hypothetical protein PLT65_01605 [Bacilli bacterium]|nr:hypothetical protein [Bacilli bacterium]